MGDPAFGVVLWSVFVGHIWAFCIGPTMGGQLLIIVIWSLGLGIALGILARIDK
jgi:hypothetical protein